jgi:hypothetical protein
MRKVSLLCLAVLAAYAQSPQATVSGNVWDPQGAAVVDAEIIATALATSSVTTARTNASGFYSLRNLPIGEYTLSITHPGFRRYQQKGIVLTTGQALQLDIQLEVGQVTETVDVTASAQMLETRTSDVSQLVETKTVEDVPLGDRRTMNLINLTPAAVFVNYDSGSKPNFSLAGGRTQSQNFFIDGGTGQNMRLGIGQIDIDPPVETVAEVKVLANNYAAEYGGSAGGVIIATTKSGSNQFRGTLFEYLRNEKLDAANFFAPIQNGEKVRAPLRYNVFGGTVGGPVRLPGLYNGKDKTFFFFAYEGSRRRDGAVRTMTVPTALERAGDFSQTRTAAGALVPVFDPATTRTEAGRLVRDQFPGNRIPANRLDPVALKLMQFWPEPNRPADNASGANNFRANFVNILTRNNFTAKVDHELTSKDRLTFRYLYNSDHSGLTSVFPNPAAETNSAAVRFQHYGYIGWTRIISPSVVNDFRWTYANRVNHQKSFGLEGEDWVSVLGLRGVPSGAFPQFNVTGVQGLGAGNHERRQFPIKQWQIVENLSWVRGKHTMKFGFEVRPSFNYEVQRTSISGQFTFSPLATGQPGVAATGFGMASLLLGLPQNFNLRETEVLDRSSYYLAWFAQTDWNVHRDLTLNLGVRWETDTPIVDRNNRMNGFDANAINPVSGTPGVVKFMGVDGFRESPYNTDWNNFGPRFGFAWKPFGSQATVVRGGGGVFFAHPFDGGAPASAALGYEQQATLNSPDNGITFPFVLGQGVPSVQLGGAARNDSFGAVRVGQNPNTAVSFYEENRATGYSMQWNFGIQREMPGNILVEAQYLANESRKLPSSSMSLNQVRPERLNPLVAATQRDRPFPQFTNVSVLFPTLGVSSYHAGVLRFNKRFSGGLNVLSTYTWSKFLNNTNEGGASLGNDGGPYSDFYNRRNDWGPSENDVPHRFTFASVYELPFGKGKRWLRTGAARHVLGDWTVSGVATMQSGSPFTVTTQVNSTFAFSAGAQRADVLRNPNLPSGERSLARWFDTSAFAQPANATFGNQGVNILRGDGLVNIDLSLLKNFPIGEQRKLQFRAESFNFTNTPWFGIPGRVLGGPGFGVVASSAPGRRIQLGLRLVW